MLEGSLTVERANKYSIIDLSMVNLQRLSGVLIVSFPGRWRPSANHPAKPSQMLKVIVWSKIIFFNVTCTLRYGTFTMCIFDVF